MLELLGYRACLVGCKDLTFILSLRSYEYITSTLKMSTDYTANVISNMRLRFAHASTNHAGASIRTPRAAKQQDACRVRMSRV